MKPVCEVNEKRTRERNDDNEISSLAENERKKVYCDKSSLTEED